MKKEITILIVLLLGLLAVGCGSAQGDLEPSATPGGVAAVETATPEPESTSAPTETLSMLQQTFAANQTLYSAQEQTQQCILEGTRISFKTQVVLNRTATAEVSMHTQTARVAATTTRQNQTSTPTPTSTATVLTIELSSETPAAAVGTPLPSTVEEIDQENFLDLQLVGTWGRGELLDVVFSPDGRHFVAGSAAGVAVYDLRDLESPPRWVTFSYPVIYEDLAFSVDGAYLRLTGNLTSNIVVMDTGEVLSDSPDIEWLITQGSGSNTTGLIVASPDLRYIFRGRKVYIPWDEENPEAWISEEGTIRGVYDFDSGDLLYELRDPQQYVTYAQRNAPEGCDFRVFSMCGNALMPVVSVPFRAEFSSTGDTLTILYRPSSIYPSFWFGTLRVYDTDKGEWIASFGDYDRPVEGFSYSPDGQTLVIGYVDGSLQLWDVGENDNRFGARHFSPPLQGLTYSYDGQFVLVQRGDTLEIRRSSDGAMRSRVESTSFAVSPDQNLAAVGDYEGGIRVLEMGSGNTVYTLEGHEAIIYALAFSEDGRFLVSSSEDCDIRLWDLETGEFIHYFELVSLDPYYENFISRPFMYSLNFVPDRDQLIGFGSWATVMSWSVNSGAVQFVVEPGALEYYQGMITLKPHFPEYFGINLEREQFSINNQIYSLFDGEYQGPYELPQGQPTECAANGPVTPDGRLRFSVGFDSLEGRVCVLDAESNELLRTFQVLPGGENAYNYLNWVYLSPDGDQLLVSAASGVLYVFQVGD